MLLTLFLDDLMMPRPHLQLMPLHLGPGTWCCLSQVANPCEYSGQQLVAP